MLSGACIAAGPCLQNLLDSRAQMAAKNASPGTMTPTSPEAAQHTHAADLLRMTRESMNGSFTARFNAAGKISFCLIWPTVL